MDSNDLDNRFKYHKPDPTTAENHQQIRTACLYLADELNAALPEGREKSLAMTNLEQTMFWANAALARSNPLSDSQQHISQFYI